MSTETNNPSAIEAILDALGAKIVERAIIEQRLKALDESISALRSRVVAVRVERAPAGAQKLPLASTDAGRKSEMGPPVTGKVVLSKDKGAPPLKWQIIAGIHALGGHATTVALGDYFSQFEGESRDRHTGRIRSLLTTALPEGYVMSNGNGTWALTDVGRMELVKKTRIA